MGSDHYGMSAETAYSISIHTPRVGSDMYTDCSGIIINEFQSTLPVWGVTLNAEPKEGSETISIHTPRVGSDSE